MVTETIRIGSGFGIDRRTLSQQPAKDLHFIGVHREVQQCSARDGSPMQSQGLILITTERWRINFLVREGLC